MAKTDFSSSSPLAGSFFAGRTTYPPRQINVGRFGPHWPTLACIGLGAAALYVFNFLQ